MADKTNYANRQILAETLLPRHHRKPRNDEARERAAAHRSGAFLSPVWRDSGKPRLPLTLHRGLGKPRSDLSLLASLYFGQMVSVASARAACAAHGA